MYIAIGIHEYDYVASGKELMNYKLSGSSLWIRVIAKVRTFVL